MKSSRPRPQLKEPRILIPHRSLRVARAIVLVRVLLLPLTALETPETPESPREALAVRAWVTRFEAKMFARQAVPDGKVKSAALTEKKGVWVWLLDLTRPHTKARTEVQIDAVSGQVVREELAPAPQSLRASRHGPGATP